MTNQHRYMTPISYVNGNGVKRTAKLYFELSPVEFIDWIQDQPFEANELIASLSELQEIHNQESRDLQQDEILMLMRLVKTLAEISHGKPSEDGEYFIKDPNWTGSYAYRAFRELLLTKPKELVQFMTTIANEEVLTSFGDALVKANEQAVQEQKQSTTAPTANAGTGKAGDDRRARLLKELNELDG